MKSAPFLIRVLICFLLSQIPLGELDQRIYSLRAGLSRPRPPKTPIVVLEISAAEFRGIKRSLSPTLTPVGSWLDATLSVSARSRADRLEGLREIYLWDPHVYGEALRRILVQGPRAILISWHIPNEVVTSLPTDSWALLPGGPRNPRIFWASQFEPEGRYVPVSHPLSAAGSAGFYLIRPDRDGEVRRAHSEWEGQPSLAKLVYETTHPPGSSRHVPIPEDYLIHYSGRPGSIPTCRLSRYLEGRDAPSCQDLAGKIIILSRSDSKLRTPVGEMSRGEILANEVHTLIDQEQIQESPWLVQAILSLAVVFLGAFYVIYYPILISSVALIGTGVAATGVLFQLLFDLLNIYIPSANLVASGLVTYLVFTGYRLAFQENLQWRSLKQAQYLRELDQMKSNFLSLVSHDLKTPLSKIQAVVERLRREAGLPSEQRSDWRELIDSIENSGNELKTYINSILNLSRIEAQKVILNKKSGDLNRSIQQTLRRLKPIAAARAIQIEEDLAPLFLVEFDENLIQQVLSNLVDNAIKYGPSNSRIIVRSREEKDRVVVSVQDFGPGIPKDQLPLMFRKFNRFLRPMKEQVKGTGLGLYLSKYFIELQGGSIWVQTEEGQGTCFSFSLPLTPCVS